MPRNNSIQKTGYLFFLLAFLLSCNGELSAQDLHTGHKHSHHDGHEVHNEIAVGAGVAFSNETSGIAPAFHLHAIRGINPTFGLGAGYELIMGEETHHSLAALINYRPFPLLDLNVGPGVVFPSEDESWSMLAKAEASLVFPITEILHAGPVLDFGWSGHGVHVITGIHIGFDL